MAFSSTHVLLGIHGVFGVSHTNPLERWTTTLRIQAIPPTPFDVALINFLADVEPEITTHHTNTFVKAGTGCWLTEITAAVIGTDGKYLLGGLQSTTRAFLTTPAQGSGVTSHPFTSAVVRSLRTARGRGRASNGRMYYPCTAFNTTVNLGGRLDTSDALGIANATATMLNGINDGAAARFGAGSEISVMSAIGTGLSAAVLNVRVGTRVDHMESRERDLPESYQTVALA
jgi:hypothetical protein